MVASRLRTNMGRTIEPSRNDAFQNGINFLDTSSTNQTGH